MAEDIPSQKQGGVQTRRSQGPTIEKPAKKMKLDDAAEVADLFTQSVRVAEREDRIDMSVKKFVYRVASAIQNESGSSKVPMDKVWKKFFLMDEKEQLNAATQKPYFESLEDIKKCCAALEEDKIAMIDGSDVILTGN